jgi:hypothetical protein
VHQSAFLEVRGDRAKSDLMQCSKRAYSMTLVAAAYSVGEMQALQSPPGGSSAGVSIRPKRSFDLEIDRGRLASVIFNLKFNVLTFIE